MGKFDSYGGNFTPKGYMKVDAGGSHEENPNGGVQVGVDPQGVPNLLEEGEPVYNDYVYSDNIVATEEFLLKNNIPKKYAGRLYSEIADSLFAEYEERELDPISKNGADAMLTRLAQAQEEQKQYEQQKELEAYLKTLSPEELQALDEQLAMIEQQGMEQMPQQPSEEEMMAMQGQQPMPQEVMQQPMPMVAALGGQINTFRRGGTKDEERKRIDAVTNAILAQAALRDRQGLESKYKMTGEAPLVSSNPIADLLTPVGDLKYTGFAFQDIKDAIKERDYLDALKTAGIAAGMFVLPEGLDIGLKGLLSSSGRAMRRGVRKGAKEAEQSVRKKVYDNIVEEGKKIAERRQTIADNIADATKEIETSSSNLAKKLSEDASREKPLSGAAKTAHDNSIEQLRKNISENSDILKTKKKEARAEWWNEQQNGWREFDANIEYRLAGGKPSSTKAVATQSSRPELTKAQKWKRAGIGLGIGTGVGTLSTLGINSWVKNKQARQLPPPPVSNTAPTDTTAIAPTVNPETGVTRFELYSAPKLAFGGRINRFDEGGNYTLPASYVIDTYKGPHINLPNFYLKDLLNGNNIQKPSLLPVNVDTTPALFPTNIDTAAMTKEMEQNLGREPLFPVDINTDDITRQSERALREADMGYFLPSVSNKATALGGRASYNDSLSQRTPTSLVGNTGSGTSLGKPYSTLGMYAPAFLGAAEGSWDAFQPIDRYRMTPVRAFEPEGKFTYEKQYYTPQDRNELINAILAQGNGLMGQIGNSGAGPSAPAAMIAADNQISQNAGKALWQGIMGNTQSKNTAIQANNQYGSIESQYNLMLDRARQAERARAQSANAQMAIPLQQLNYGAEGDYYAALQNQSQAVAQALADIARMKFAYNQINSDTSNEGYRGSMTGWSQYGGNNAKCGGHIKRKK